MEDQLTELGKKMVSRLRNEMSEKYAQIISNEDYKRLDPGSRVIAVGGVCTEISTQLIMLRLLRDSDKVIHICESRWEEYRSMCMDIDLEIVNRVYAFMKGTGV